jgi:hypothetical protein
MKRLEQGAWAIAILGILFRVMLWPGAGVLLVLGLSTVAIVYFPLGWMVLGKPTRKDQLIPLSVITGLVLSLLTIGILFKLQFWPGADFDLLMGLLGAIVVEVSILSLHSRNPGIEHYFKGLRHRVLLIGLPALLLYLVPANTLVQAMYRSDPERGALILRIQENQADTAARRALYELDRERSEQ